ncbi:alanine racemase [Zhihengliuella halotolerans]|uniref:alanine racemase n=1 Tax=Zhihengliuella halotolerans TaxID=370736 RepID=UPI000C80F3C7|nr:alanine racemase [Zhihengliuella halotolerans]
MTTTSTVHALIDPDTPFAVVDEEKALRNAQRLRAHLDRLGVVQRPHVKTSKSVPAALMMHGDQPGPITVSTLAEAEGFAAAGFIDITYAVGIAQHKLPRVIELLRRAVTVTVLVDSIEQARAVAAASAEENLRVPALIEIDADGHRGGVLPGHPILTRIGRILHDAGCLAGVLTHAGESYFAATDDAKRAAALEERDAVVEAAQSLRAAGITVETVSMGSTPTAHFAEDLTGVTEVRAGNYIFFDLVMAGIGVCRIEDIALSVVVTVIGHRPEKGWVLTDGGWMATSRDRGTARQFVDQGYGLIADLDGTLIPGLVMTDASQEHGILTVREGQPLPDLPIGTRLRVLPNHACATAAQYARYHVIGRDRTITDTWDRIQGW